MGVLKQIVACLATCAFKSKCKMNMCSCCVSDCMVEEKPCHDESISSSSVQSNKIKQTNKQLINRIRTTMI